MAKAQPTFKDPQDAFNQAISDGRLTAKNAGAYMYMGTWGDVDTFKNKDTRDYLPEPGDLG